MAEERIYTIIVQRERVEVSREVYYAYHKACLLYTSDSLFALYGLWVALWRRLAVV